MQRFFYFCTYLILYFIRFRKVLKLVIDFLFSMSFHKAKQKLGMDVYEVWQLKFWKNSKMKKKSECVMFHTFGCHIFTWSWISIYVYFVVVDQFSSSCQWKTQITRLSKLNSMTYKSMFSSWKCVANSMVVIIRKTPLYIKRTDLFPWKSM